MKKLAIALASVFILAQAAPVFASPDVVAAKHMKCKKGEKMDPKTNKCVKDKK